MTLLELADRCEKAEGRQINRARDIESAKLDCLIWLAVRWPDRQFRKFIQHRKPGLTEYGSWVARTSAGDMSVYAAPSFTYSLDAALTLVPEGCLWIMDSYEGNRWSAGVWQEANRRWLLTPSRHCQLASPALALTAAALRARAAQ